MSGRDELARLTGEAQTKQAARERAERRKPAGKPPKGLNPNGRTPLIGGDCPPTDSRLADTGEEEHASTPLPRARRQAKHETDGSSFTTPVVSRREGKFWDPVTGKTACHGLVVQPHHSGTRFERYCPHPDCKARSCRDLEGEWQRIDG